jgi:gamma-glutamylcyclotransferase (GGCT)/AIG2-like uncharacterized protein YtfP
MAPPSQGARGRKRELTPSVTKLFVYGSLMPDHEAWPILERWTVGEPRRDAAVGTLFDTRRGYPCATFTSSGGTTSSELVHGVVVDLDPDRLDIALATLDAYEASEYDRIVVRTVGLEEAYTYAWVAPLDRCVPVAGGRWTD